MRKWLVGIIILTVAVVLGSGVFVDHQLSKMFGGHTQVADLTLTAETSSDLVLTNVNVLAPSADSFIGDQTVLISNGSIASFGQNVEFSNDVPRLDGGGLFLVPGFVDSHVHLWESENDLLLYVANGVTQVREMNGSDVHLAWKKEIEAGRIGPDLFVVAPQLANFDSPWGWFAAWTQRKTNVRSEEQIRAAAQLFASKGYDAIKASSFLDKAGYEAISKLTTADSLPLVGHLPIATGLDDLWRSNQTEVAHIEELVKALNREFGGFDGQNTTEFLQFVQTRSDDIADQLLAKGIAVTSTILLIDSFPQQKTDLDGMLKGTELRYANPGITEGTVITSRGMGWLPDVNIYRWPDDIDEEGQQSSLSYWRAYSQAQHIMFKALLKTGVPIMAGTDANVPIMVPGFSLHDEMKSLKDSGMSNAQVLASATTVPAEWMRTNTGKISPGYKANLVLLRENPLENIEATDSIEMVILNGRALSRSDLNELLLAVQHANDENRAVQL